MPLFTHWLNLLPVTPILRRDMELGLAVSLALLQTVGVRMVGNDEADEKKCHVAAWACGVACGSRPESVRI